jgi:hypothetical protein
MYRFDIIIIENILPRVLRQCATSALHTTIIDDILITDISDNEPLLCEHVCLCF